jgi:hypothetical protein
MSSKFFQAALLGVVAVLGVTFAVSCGGGGGGGSSSRAAHVSLSIRPSQIDSGDYTNIVARISDIKQSAFALKVRFPVELSYLSHSSLYVVGGNQIDTGPDENGTDGRYNYLVYYVTQSTFGSLGRGELHLKLLGKADNPNGNVALDADWNNPITNPGYEFDPTDPQFDPQSEGEIIVGPAPECSSSSCSSKLSSKSSSSSSSKASSSAASSAQASSASSSKSSAKSSSKSSSK